MTGEFKRDLSTPEVLPTQEALLTVFDQHLRVRDQSVIDDPEQRVRLIQNKLLPSYPTLTYYLHNRLTRRHEQNSSMISGREVMRPQVGHDHFLMAHGLDMWMDTEPHILPAVQLLFNEVAESSLAPRTKLARMAAIAGIVTAESQSLSDGNKRVARTLYDFVLNGRDLKVTHIFNNRSFLPPQNIEELIMMQNVARLVDAPDDADERDRPLGGACVPGTVRDSVSDAQNFLMAHILRDDKSVVTPLEPKERRDYRRKVELYDRVDSMIAVQDDNERAIIAATLLQYKYGAAAWAVAFGDDMPGLPLSETDARVLYEKDVQLLRMRVISLATAMAAGGLFVTVEKSWETGTNKFDITSWAPDWIH